MAQYGAPNPVYEANNTPLVNRGQQQNQMSQRGSLGSSLGLGAVSPLMGLLNYFKPQATNGIRDMFMGKDAYNEQVPTITPEVQQALSQMLQYGLGGMNNNQFDFAPIEQQARTQFNQQTIPSIAERFTSMGGQGGGAFQRMLGSAGAGLEENLAAMKSQYNLQREPLMQNYLRMGMMPQFENQYNPEQPGLFKSLLSQLIPAGAQLGTAYLTGGASMLPKAASQFGSMFSQPTNKGMFGQQGQFKPQGFGYQFS